ncbi:hypothetical protein ACET3Z_011966 [Daucus carota]
MDESLSGFSMKARGCGGGGNKCGRWNPTSEQVKVLTDLFRSGLRTPSTDQIQKISTQLSFYGKIENKNVFYWFQNHKARERQKRRRVYNVSDPADDEIIHCKDKVSSIKQFGERKQVVSEEPERVIETLQLFPLNSFDESESEKLRLYASECNKENGSTFIYSFGRDQVDNPYHPPLDLRLSFV